VNDTPHRQQYTELCNPFKLTYPRSLQSGSPDHRWVRVTFLKVLDDGERLDEIGSIIKLENRQFAEGVSSQVRRPSLFAFPEVDRYLGKVDHRSTRSFLSEIEAYLVGLGAIGKT
jgi:hypothetical protein